MLALAVDPEEALLEYLDMFYKLGRAGRGLRRIGAIDFATTIAPGMRDVLLTGKVYEAVRRKADKRPVYDAVVLDAPPTGRITRFLDVNAEVAGLAKVGPIRSQADAIMALLTSPQTAVHLVTLLEEMPVQETVDAVAELTAAGLPVGGIVVNAVRAPLLKVADLTAAAKGRLPRARRGRQGWSPPASTSATAGVDALLAEAPSTPSGSRWRRPSAARSKALGRPTYELPLLPRASTSAACTRWRSASARRGWRDGRPAARRRSTSTP